MPSTRLVAPLLGVALAACDLSGILELTGIDGEPPPPPGSSPSGEIDPAPALEWAIGAAGTHSHEVRRALADLSNLAGLLAGQPCVESSEDTTPYTGGSCETVSQDTLAKLSIAAPCGDALGTLQRAHQRRACFSDTRYYEERDVFGALDFADDTGIISLDGAGEVLVEVEEEDQPSAASHKNAALSYQLSDLTVVRLAGVSPIGVFGPGTTTVTMSGSTSFDTTHPCVDDLFGGGDGTESLVRQTQGSGVAHATTTPWLVDWALAWDGDTCMKEPSGAVTVEVLEAPLGALAATAALTFPGADPCDGCGDLTVNGAPAGMICDALPLSRDLCGSPWISDNECVDTTSPGGKYDLCATDDTWWTDADYCGEGGDWTYEGGCF